MCNAVVVNQVLQSRISLYFFWPQYLIWAFWKWKSRKQGICSSLQDLTTHVPFLGSMIGTCGFVLKSRRSVAGDMGLNSEGSVQQPGPFACPWALQLTDTSAFIMLGSLYCSLCVVSRNISIVATIFLDHKIWKKSLPLLYVVLPKQLQRAMLCSNKSSIAPRLVQVQPPLKSMKMDTKLKMMMVPTTC